MAAEVIHDWGHLSGRRPGVWGETPGGSKGETPVGAVPEAEALSLCARSMQAFRANVNVYKCTFKKYYISFKLRM